MSFTINYIGNYTILTGIQNCTNFQELANKLQTELGTLVRWENNSIRIKGRFKDQIIGKLI